MPAPHRPGRVPIPRRLRRARRDEAPDGPGVVASEPLGPAETAASVHVDVQVALTRAEVDALVHAVQPRRAADHAWTVTPERLRSAVEDALGPDLADGWVLVTRLPRALHSTESWHIRLAGVTPTGRDRIVRAVRSARLASAAPAPEADDVR